MTFNIIISPLSPDLKKHIFDTFSHHAIQSTGMDGLKDPISIELRNQETLIGCVVVLPFWGQLHIKYLMVEEAYRGCGYGKVLMEQAFIYGKEIGCQFAFVETMNFQAPEFYQKLGFKMDFNRVGFDQGTSFCYLSKNLMESKHSSIHLKILQKADIPLIVQQFAEVNWPKPAEIFQAYAQEQEAEKRLVWLAYSQEQFAGYGTLVWHSPYQPFADAHIPEIKDLNVLPSYRGQGIASQILDTAECQAAHKSTHVGIGVGLYAGYGMAQKLYIKRGYIPDGLGVTHNYEPALPGKSVALDDDLVLWFTKKIR